MNNHNRLYCSVVTILYFLTLIHYLEKYWYTIFDTMEKQFFSENNVH